MITASLYFESPMFAQAKTSEMLTTQDRFLIPEKNGSISFAFNGSYSKATFDKGTWTFKDLNLEHPSTFLGFDLNSSRTIGDLRMSCENSNVTIWAYLAFYYTLPVYSLVYYTEGAGEQTVNLGLNSTEASDPTEWSVITGDNVFLAEGQGWTLQADNTLTITGASGNVTVAHFEVSPLESDLLFSMQHSVSILTAIVLGVVVLSAVIIRVRKRKEEHNHTPV